MCNCELIEELKAKIKHDEGELAIAENNFGSHITEYIKRKIERSKRQLEKLEPCEGDCEYKLAKAAEEQQKQAIEDRLVAIEKAIKHLTNMDIEKRLLDIEKNLIAFNYAEKNIKAIIKQVKNNSDTIQKVLSEFESIKKEL